MRDVVSGEEGGARHAFADTPYDSAGKTGTAQLFTVGQNEKYDATKIDERLRDNAMYVGFAPFNDPEISVTVVLENVGGASFSDILTLTRKVQAAVQENYRIALEPEPVFFNLSRQI